MKTNLKNIFLALSAVGAVAALDKITPGAGRIGARAVGF